MRFFQNLITRASGLTPEAVEPAKESPLVPAVSATPAPSEPTAPVRRPRKADIASYISNLDAPLVHLSPTDSWTLRDACAATHVFGGNGSGKTSGSGQTLAKAFLRAGFGGLVLCAKHDERDTWLRYAKETGREKQVIVISPEQPWRFNLIHYELHRAQDPARAVENLLTTFMNIMDHTSPNQGGQGDAEFWKEAARNLLRNLLLLASAAIPDFTIADLRKLVATAPHKRTELADDHFARTEFGMTLAKARITYEEAGQLADFDAMAFYWLYDFPSMPENTRGSVTFTLTTMLQYLQTGTLRELFSTDLNVFPEDTHEGAIIILDLPVISNDANRMAQILFKVVWQFAAIRRIDGINDNTRPIFLWADESQFFVTPSDTDFQSLARASRACSVYMTQNISAYHQRFGGSNANATAEAFVGYFQTIIFHAQPNPATNQLAQNLFGKVVKERASTSHGTNSSRNLGYSFNTSSGYSGGQGSGSSGRSYSDSDSYGSSETYGTQEGLEEALQFGDLASLKTGSPANDFRVGAYIFSTGRVWGYSGSNCLYTEFNQRL